MSGHDVEAQQHGGKPAAAAAMDDAAVAPPPLDMSRTAGIAKDGTHAPLEGTAPPVDRFPATSEEVAESGSSALEGAAQPGTAEEGGNLIAKDGSTMPLAEEQGGGDRNLAMSGQDVDAQQHGGKTAAAAALDDDCRY